MKTNLLLFTMLMVAMLAAMGGCSQAADGQEHGSAAQNVGTTTSQTVNSKNDSTNGNTDAMSKTQKLSKSGYDITPLSRERVKELAATLTPEQYKVTQTSGTERAFCGTLLDNKKDGMYVCVVCRLPLFSSDAKFNSGTGWPSFYREFDPEHVSRKTDEDHGMVRVEINCARCGSHLGHVFDDGPKPTGERHCLNSASLTFYEKGEKLPTESMPVTGAGAAAASASSQPANETAYFAGGCFWGIEHFFQKGPGVIEAVSGYMQGKVDNPTYKQVCSDTTGHAEAVKVVFDPKKITYKRLLQAFFDMHDPTQLNRQGPDYGEQYRSGIFYTSEDQKKQAEAFIKELQASGKVSGKIVTQVEAAKKFYPAEEYHQDYVEKTGRPCHVHNPW